MADSKELKYEYRDYISFGPHCAITCNDTRPNADSTALFSTYCYTKEKNQFNLVFNESGSYKMFNDRGIEIAAGNKGSDGNIDIKVSSMGGDICITATSDGSIKIKGHQVMIEAGEDLDLKASKNITLDAGSGRIVLKGDKVDDLTMKGNGCNNNFTSRAFSLAHISDVVDDLNKVQDPLSALLGIVGVS